MTQRQIDTLAALLSAAPAELADTVRATDELCADASPLEEGSIRKLLLAINDSYSHIEILDSLLGRLEIEESWTDALFHCADALERSAPEILRSRIARALNDATSRQRLATLVKRGRDENADALLRVASELARSPKPRPGDSARAFLAEVK